MGDVRLLLTSMPICARRPRRYSESVVVDMGWAWIEDKRGRKQISMRAGSVGERDSDGRNRETDRLQGAINDHCDGPDSLTLPPRDR